MAVIPQPNAVWVVDFMSNTLYGDRRFQTPNVLDGDVREGLAIEMDTSLSMERVIRLEASGELVRAAPSDLAQQGP